MGSADEIMQMCRLCLVKDQVNIPIFDEPTDIKQTFLKISSCLPVKVSREDNLPKKICDDCSYKLDVAYQFRNTSSSSEKQLIQLLEQFGIPAQTAISGKSEISVKLENVITEDGNICPDTQNYILQQQKLPYQQSFAEFGEASSSDAPPRKRAKRASATSKKSATATSVQEILTDPLVDSSPAATITKAEEDSNDSDDMVLSTFASASATSANDQAGPSGVGKGNIDAPIADFLSITLKAQRPFTCNMCGVPFPNASRRKRHMQLHREKTHSCDICFKVYRFPYELRNHKQVVHEAKQTKVCDICDAILKTDDSYHKHMLTHTKDYKFKCDQCESGFVTKKLLDDHKEVVHQGIRFICEYCRKIFKNRDYFKIHQKKHDPNYIKAMETCPLCFKVFTDRSNFRKHMKRHDEGVKRYVCEMCGKSLCSRESLRLHKMTHTGEKQVVCDFCGKAFIKKQLLEMHMRVHTKEKPFKCTVCERSFSQKSSLNVHLRYHTGERPYKCELCQKGFITGTLLKNHTCLRKGNAFS